MFGTQSTSVVGGGFGGGNGRSGSGSGGFRFDRNSSSAVGTASAPAFARTGGFSFGGGGDGGSGGGTGSFGGTTTAAATASSGGPCSDAPAATATGWDPKFPSALYIVTNSSCSSSSSFSDASAKAGVGPQTSFRTFLADDGVGCNDMEASALMKLLDARDDYFKSRVESSNMTTLSSSKTMAMASTAVKGVGAGAGAGVGGGAMSLRILSGRYRKALEDCMSAWDEQLAERKDRAVQVDAQVDDGDEEEGNSLELLKLCYAVMHLSEIYLLPPTTPHGTSLMEDGTLVLFSPDDAAAVSSSSSWNVDSRRPPGSVTADTVRYLRHNHMADPYVGVMDGDGNVVDVDDMLESRQPEYYGNESGGIAGTGSGSAFWSLLRRLVLRGCLRDAWNVLTRHSACRRCLQKYGGGGGMDEDDDEGRMGGYHDATTQEDYAAFAALQDVFLRAPLPGGLTDAYDAILGGGGGGGEDEKNEEEDNDGEYADRSYRLWDNHGSGDSPFSPHSDAPLRYDRNAALSAHRRWREDLSALVDSHRSPLGPTLRRIPPLRRLLDVLLGRFDDAGFVQGGRGWGTSVGSVEGGRGRGRDHVVDAIPFESWAEALCAELLYVRPDVRPGDVSVRARAAVKACGVAIGGGGGNGDNGDSSFEGIVLGVMRGDAGRAVEALHGAGGGSGAALPATITALLCNLLADAGRIPTYDPSAATPDLQTEFLLSASSSILSSFAQSGLPDVGMRLSTRLLLPHAAPSSRIGDGPERLLATLTDGLSRHWPQTDAEARDLLILTSDLCDRGCRLAADASDSLALCRATDHERSGRPGGAAHWLLRGLERCHAAASAASGGTAATVVGTAVVAAQSACGRRFVSLCGRSAASLVRSLAAAYRRGDRDVGRGAPGRTAAAYDAEIEQVGRLLELCCEIVRSASDDEKTARLAGELAETRLLRLAVGIAEDRARGSNRDAARGIARCLEDRASEAWGDVSTLAPPCMYGDLLSLAYGLLLDDSGGGKDCGAQSAFDVAGIHTLMTRFSQLELRCSSPASISASHTEKGTSGGGTPTRNAVEGVDDHVFRDALCRGLVEAFLSENAMLGIISNAQDGSGAEKTRNDAGGALALDRTVDLMLALSM